MNKDIGRTGDTYQQKIQECLESVQNKIEGKELINEINSLHSIKLTIIQIHFLIQLLINQMIIMKGSNYLNLNFGEQFYQDIQPLIKHNFTQQQKLTENLSEQSNQQVQLLTNKLNIQQSQTIQSIHQTNLKPFTYQLIPQYSISQNDSCRAIAINKDCSTLLAGCSSQTNLNIKRTQELCQYFKLMNKSYFWKCRQQYHYMVIKILNGHSNSIYCLILNNNEDLIVSGSTDETIKFQMKKNEWTCYQTIQDHSHYVKGLSFNQQQNRVISCGHETQILIIELQEQNKEWIVIQKITVEQVAYRVCFIDNNMFTLSQDSKEQISVFEMNSINKQFTKTKDIEVKCRSDSHCLFPQQYINSRCILVSKNGEYVNLIRKKQNGEFLTEQSIHFGTNYLFGGMCEDGEYLITWEQKSKEIQIRRYKEQ